MAGKTRGEEGIKLPLCSLIFLFLFKMSLTSDGEGPNDRSMPMIDKLKAAEFGLHL